MAGAAGVNGLAACGFRDVLVLRGSAGAKGQPDGWARAEWRARTCWNL